MTDQSRDKMARLHRSVVGALYIGVAIVCLAAIVLVYLGYRFDTPRYRLWFGIAGIVIWVQLACALALGFCLARMLRLVLRQHHAEAPEPACATGLFYASIGVAVFSSVAAAAYPFIARGVEAPLAISAADVLIMQLIIYFILSRIVLHCPRGDSRADQ